MKGFNLEEYVKNFNKNEGVERLKYFNKKGREYVLCPLEFFEEENTEIGLAYYVTGRTVRATAYKRESYYGREEDEIKVYNDSTCVSATSIPVSQREARMDLKEYDDFVHVEEMENEHYWNKRLNMNTIDSLKQNITFWYLNDREDIKGHNFLSERVVSKVYDTVYANEPSLRESIFATRINEYLDEIMHRAKYKQMLSNKEFKEAYERNDENLENLLRKFNDFVTKRGLVHKYFEDESVDYTVEPGGKKLLIDLFNKRLEDAGYETVNNLYTITKYLSMDTRLLEPDEDKLRNSLEDVIREEDVGLLSNLFFLVGEDVKGAEYSRAKEVFEEYVRTGEVSELRGVEFAVPNFINMLDEKINLTKSERLKYKRRAWGIGASIPAGLMSLASVLPMPNLTSLLSYFVVSGFTSTMLATIVSYLYWNRKSESVESDLFNKDEAREKRGKYTELKKKLEEYTA